MITLTLVTIVGGGVLATKGLGEHGIQMLFIAIGTYVAIFAFTVLINRSKLKKKKCLYLKLSLE